MDARTVAKMPRKFAHPCRLFGRAIMKYMERMKITTAWRTDVAVTARAVRKEGPSESFAESVVEGVARGKKMRNKRSL